MRLLVDTCVIIDALAERKPGGDAAKELLLLGGEDKISLIASSKTFLDVHYIMKHCLNNETLVREKMATLLNAISPCSTPSSAIISALSSATNDYEDAVQAETALCEGVDYIVTSDKKGFSLSPIKSISAQEAIALYRKGDTLIE